MSPLKTATTRLREMIFGRMGGQGSGGFGSWFRVLLPGSNFDYAREVGDVWRNSAAYIGLAFMARSCVKPKFKVCRESADDDDDDEVEGHPLAKLLRRPNKYHSYADLIRLTVLQLSTGNAYWLKIWDRSQQNVIALYPVPSIMIEPWSDSEDELVSYYRYSPGAQIIQLDPADVVHFKTGIDPDYPMKGLSDLAYLAREQHADNSIGTMGAALARNLGVPGVIITPGDDGDIHNDDVEAIRNSLWEKTTGPERGKPMVLRRSIKIDKLSWSPKEMDVSWLRNAPAERICAAIGLNTMALGLPSENKTYSNYEESLRAAWHQGVLPLLDTMAETIEHQLLPDFSDDENERVEFDVRNVPALSENEDAKAERVGKLYQVHQVIKRGEARKQLGFDAEPEDDVYFAGAVTPPATDQPVGIDGKPVDATEEATEDPESEPDPTDPESNPADEPQEGVPAKMASVKEADRGVEAWGSPKVGDENNTYGLPSGDDIAKSMRNWYYKQSLFVLGQVAKLGVGSPTVIPPLTDYNDPMATVFTPILGGYWDKSGRQLRERMGLDPDEWRVIDPRVHKMIADQSMSFCASTNASTGLQLQDALAQLRKEMIEGIVTEGDSLGVLADRVKAIFTGLTDSHAEMIAQTESSRAVHRASLESAKQSGVVVGKKWLLSTNACPICHSFAGKNQMGLEEAFGRVGTHAEYAEVQTPPAHPRCRCTSVYVLNPEYEALIGDEPVPKEVIA